MIGLCAQEPVVVELSQESIVHALLSSQLKGVYIHPP